MANTNTILTDVEQALQAVEALLPTVLGVVGDFYAPAKILLPFLPLLQTALQGVQIVQQATGASTAEATAAVQNTLTPGQPNAPALS